MSAYRRDVVIIGLIALIVGVIMAALLHHPGYTDAYYYFNAGQRLAQGKGLTDVSLWTYIGAPAGLPVPSHLYWMPLASLIAAVGMFIGGPTFNAARLLYVPLYAGVVVTGFAVGAILGKSRRMAWIAGLLTMFSGYFMPYWTTTSTFAPYALAGSLALLTMGLGRRAGNQPGSWRWFALSGALCGLAHLARADGVLLVGVLIVVAVWRNPSGWRAALVAVLIGVAAYLLVMTPWFVRNLNAIGAILPSGGLQSAWSRSYNELFNYPPVISLQAFMTWGPMNIIASRWGPFIDNLKTFIGVEGLVILLPLMLIGVWRRRFDPLLSGFWLYALGLHAVMTLVFAFSGSRGGLFHSSSALIPFWAALAALGLDDVLAWIAPRRRWRLPQAQMIFSSAMVVWAALFSIITFTGKIPGINGAGDYFQQIAQHIPPDAVVIINDASALHYFTGVSGIVMPNAPPDVIPELAKRYGANYLVLDQYLTDPLIDLYEGRVQPTFLNKIYDKGDVQIYRITE